MMREEEAYDLGIADTGGVPDWDHKANVIIWHLLQLLETCFLRQGLTEPRAHQFG